MTRFLLGIDNIVKDEIVVFDNHYEKNGLEFSGGLTPSHFRATISVTALMSMTDKDFVVLRDWICENIELAMRKKFSEENLLEYEMEQRKREYFNSDEFKERERKYKNTREEGYVYLIGSDIGRYKIGKTYHVNDRLLQLSVKLPVRIFHVHSFKSNFYSKSERYLHDMFAKKRDVGEWFSLSDEDVNFIKSITDYSLDENFK